MGLAVSMPWLLASQRDFRASLRCSLERIHISYRDILVSDSMIGADAMPSLVCYIVKKMPIQPIGECTVVRRLSLTQAGEI